MWHPNHDAGFALLAAGFAVKVGLIPVHVWMPRGYQAAPGPLRAVMAGVAVNGGFYGLWRTLALLLSWHDGRPDARKMMGANYPLRAIPNRLITGLTCGTFF